MCHSGVGLTPVVDGAVHNFSAGGLYNGLVLLIDDETRTYWDHITGEAVHGPLHGKALDAWPIEITTVAAELARHPDALLSISKPPLCGRLFGRFLHRRKIDRSGFIPPPFYKTMGTADQRLPEREQGLGVMIDGRAVFYPCRVLDEPIESTWGDRTLRVARGEIDRVPFASFTDDGSRPFQLFTRWYGFAYTFPGCEIHEAIERP